MSKITLNASRNNISRHHRLISELESCLDEKPDPVTYDDDDIQRRIAKMRDAKIAYYELHGRTYDLPNDLAAKVELD